jgi:hypothetical protein
MGKFAPGIWDAYLEVELGGPPARFRIETDAQTVAAPRRLWGRLRGGAMLRSVRPYATSGKGRLSTVVLKMTTRTAFRRILR